jgi:hypothetical protein
VSYRVKVFAFDGTELPELKVDNLGQLGDCLRDYAKEPSAAKRISVTYLARERKQSLPVTAIGTDSPPAVNKPQAKPKSGGVAPTTAALAAAESGTLKVKS